MKRLAAVTGATGFLGGHVLRSLVGDGWRLRLLVRRDPRLALGPDPVELVAGDLHDRDAVSELVAGADAVIHIAGAIKARNRADFMSINRDGTREIAAAWDAHAPDARFVLISSLAAREPSLSHYAASKASAEDILHALAPGRAHVLRPTAIYGPGDRETLAVFKAARLPVHPLLGRRGSLITLVHAADVARAVLACATTAPAGTYEVTDAMHQGYAWGDVIGAACAAIGRTRRAFHLPTSVLRLVGMGGDLGASLSSRVSVTSQKVNEILHPDWSSSLDAQINPCLWRPEYELSDGFSDAVTWYRNAGWLHA
ncbi:MAG: NAD-dependent epimerase/dehydratase family protein [Pseudomonadota bacterium]